MDDRKANTLEMDDQVQDRLVVHQSLAAHARLYSASGYCMLLEGNGVATLRAGAFEAIFDDSEQHYSW